MSEDTKRLNVLIPIELHTEIKVKTALQNTTIAQWVIEALQEKLEKEKQ